jgi:hypothetical protein
MIETTLQYPIGKLQTKDSYTQAEITANIAVIRTLPAQMRAAVAGLSDAQLDTPYREGGWTVRQVVHHVPDSHINAYVRMRLAATEQRPIIKPYDEEAWAKLPDYHLPIAPSLLLLAALHGRWVEFLTHISDWQVGFVHPSLLANAKDSAGAWKDGFHADNAGIVTLAQALATYAWHSQHHLAHITRLRERMGW